MNGPAAPAPGARHGGVDRTGVAYLVVAVVSVGAAAVLVRLAGAPALTTSFFRLAVGGAVLVVGALWHRQMGPRPDAAPLSLPHVFGAGVLLALHFALWIASLSRTTVAASVVLVCLQPVFVALLAWGLLRERIARPVAAGIAVAFGGAALIALDGNAERGATAVDPLAGNLLALGGAVAIALYVLVLRAQRSDILTTSAAVTTTAALVLWPVCLSAGAPLQPTSPSQAGWLLALALGPQVIGHTALNAALQRMPAAIVSGSILGEPVIASALAWVVLDERPGAATMAGSLVTLAGLTLLLRPRP